MLGTGNATVTECYNTCFVLSGEGKHLLVDGGGGNTVLRRLKQAGTDWKDIRDIFVTHKHIDHLLGIIWMARMICQNMSRGTYDGEARIYAHDEVIALIDDMARKLLGAKESAFIGKRLHLITLTCCGDEPYNECERRYAEGSKWLLHEAFCLHSQAETFKPYEKHHSTVKDACELAERLGVKNLLLYHTEDKNIKNRKELYTAEGRLYYHGNLYVPDDLEAIEL